VGLGCSNKGAGMPRPVRWPNLMNFSQMLSRAKAKRPARCTERKQVPSPEACSLCNVTARHEPMEWHGRVSRKTGQPGEKRAPNVRCAQAAQRDQNITVNNGSTKRCSTFLCVELTAYSLAPNHRLLLHVNLCLAKFFTDLAV
jgi:hypothetical protein